MKEEAKSVLMNTIQWLKNHPDPMVKASGQQVEACIGIAYDLVDAMNKPSDSYYDRPDGGRSESQQERFGIK